MKRTFTFYAACGTFLFLMMMSILSFSQDKNLIAKIKGSWSGKMNVGATELTLVINITPDEKGNFTVTIDSPDQGVRGIATSKVSATTDSLIVKSGVLKASYLGAFEDNFSRLKGNTKLFTRYAKCHVQILQWILFLRCTLQVVFSTVKHLLRVISKCRNDVTFSESCVTIISESSHSFASE